MKIVPAPHDLRARYEAEQRWAARILEFGCGHGDTLAALAGEGREVLGSDVKETLEALLRLPFPGRVPVYKVLALHTVCLVMRRPPGRRDRDAAERA